MKKVLLATLAFLTVFASCKKDPAPTPTPEPTPEPTVGLLVINELNGTDKFIELYNAGETELDLTGYYMVKDDREEHNWDAADGLKLAAGGFLLLYSEDVVVEGEPQFGYDPTLVFHSGLSSKKTVKIEMFNKAEESVDVFTRGEGEWGTTISDVKPASYARIGDGTGDWKLHETVTPGAANPTEGGTAIPQE